MLPHELCARVTRNESIVILDVREDWEWRIANIGGIHIPLLKLPMRYGELDPHKPFVCLCHHGLRGAQAAGFLRWKNFLSVTSLVGGIDAWSLLVDPKVARYF